MTHWHNDTSYCTWTLTLTANTTPCTNQHKPVSILPLEQTAQQLICTTVSYLLSTAHHAAVQRGLTCRGSQGWSLQGAEGPQVSLTAAPSHAPHPAAWGICLMSVLLHTHRHANTHTYTNRYQQKVMVRVRVRVRLGLGLVVSVWVCLTGLGLGLG